MDLSTLDPSIDPFVVLVSREDVERRDIGPTLGVLKHLFQSVDVVRAFRNRVDVWFDGYDADRRELFEIPEVRQFVYNLDLEFPYWMYFLTKQGGGLKALAFCFLPPFLTEDGQRRIWPQRLGELIEKRWGPALLEIGTKAGYSMPEIDEMLSDALHYFVEGPRLPFDSDSVG